MTRLCCQVVRKLSGGVLLLGTLVLTATSLAADLKSEGDSADPQRIPLWNGRAPVGDGKSEEAEAWITVHRPTKGNGAAIVICPGGGYGGLVTGAEGHGIAKWLTLTASPAWCWNTAFPKVDLLCRC